MVKRKARGGASFAIRSELSLSGPYSLLKGSSGLTTDRKLHDSGWDYVQHCAA